MSTQQLIEQVLKRLDDLKDDAAAHIWPEDLKRCMTSECFVEVASVRMGSPDGKTVPLFSREQVAEALAAELERLERKPQWLPIESAPKDGRAMLLGYFNGHGNWRTMRGQWIEAFDDDDADEPDGANAGWYEVTVEAEDDPPNCWPTKPTHWMPLPAAPDIGEGEGK